MTSSSRSLTQVRFHLHSFEEDGITVYRVARNGTAIGTYAAQRLSLVRRDGTTLNGIDTTFCHVTFGDTWDAGVTVPPYTTVVSDPIPFYLLAG